MNHEIIYASPAKAEREADTIVTGRATLEARHAIANTTNPIVTGKGIILLLVEVRIIVTVVVFVFVVLVLLVVEVSVTQSLLLSAVCPLPQSVTHTPDL